LFLEICSTKEDAGTNRDGKGRRDEITLLEGADFGTNRFHNAHEFVTHPVAGLAKFSVATIRPKVTAIDGGA